MEILNSFLAQIFEKFKAGNPTLAAILAVILVLLNLNIDPILASLNISGALASTIKVVLLSISAILGSKTYQFLPQNAKEIKSKKDVKL